MKKTIRLHARTIEIPRKSTLTISYGSEDAAVATLAEPYQHDNEPHLTEARSWGRT